MEQVAGPANQPLPEEDEFEEDEDEESSPKVQVGRTISLTCVS